MCRLIVIAIFLTLSAGCSTVPAPACPQPPTQLLLPAPNLDPLPPAPLTEQVAVETWLSDVERYWIVRRRYEALQLWGSRCWGADSTNN